MASMQDLSRWIRDYGHEARHLPRLIANRFIWHQLWTAMDIIDDVDCAMDSYLENEFPTDAGEQYLRVYGAMQGLFLQQDAIFDLIKAIHPAKKIIPTDVLKDIREARNASIGHPTQLHRKGALSAHAIVRNSMCKDGFKLHSYPERNGNISWYIPVLKLIGKQREETIRILSEVVNDLREQEQAHRATFRDVKLLKAFDQAGYAFEKIFEEISGRSPMLSRWAVGHLQKTLDRFSEFLKERGLSTDSYNSIEYLYKEIEHPLAELRKFLVNEPSEILSGSSAVVFADALRGYFDRLRHIAREIDEEYASAPEPIVLPERPNIPMTFTTTVLGQ